MFVSNNKPAMADARAGRASVVNPWQNLRIDSAEDPNIFLANRAGK